MRRYRRLAAVATALSVAGCTPSPAPREVTPTPAPTVSKPPAPASLDVSKYEEAAFSAPNGNLWCVLYSDGISCLIPRGYRGAAPKQAEPCPSWNGEDDLRPNTIDLGPSGKPQWVCLDDQAARPFKDDPASGWQRGFGTWRRIDDQLIAVLPHGKSLRHGVFQCASAASGVTCTNTRTKHGIKLSQQAVTLS
ncbi:hypothetical protein [Nigerium massiliense]|uniref:hypothetical protein n=1 Tax=Nigerium massiliense TaxID=1522317 RepID=UPI0011CA835D|nr:hypothetical protein [Nigerium massiliense]